MWTCEIIWLLHIYKRLRNDYLGAERWYLALETIEPRTHYIDSGPPHLVTSSAPAHFDQSPTQISGQRPAMHYEFGYRINWFGCQRIVQ
jgi:hypothetical protein